MAIANFTLDVSLVKEYFQYDAETGILSWKKNQRKSLLGVSCGHKRKDGYLQTHFKCVHYLTHRLVWIFVYDEHPDGYLDHINGNRSDNRIENLRIVTKKQNAENRKKRQNKSSKFKGVCFRKDSNKWTAQIGSNYKLKHLGYFETEELAYEAYKKAAELLHTRNNVNFQEIV